MSGENYLNSVGMCYLQGIKKKSEKYKYCFCRQWNVFLFRQTNKIFFSITGQGIDLDYCDVEWLALETEIILSFLRLHPILHFRLFC